MAKKKGILEKLKEGLVLGDGGYLLELEKRGWVRAGPFTPEVALLYPDALRELHVEFREAGAEVLQALTFYASRDKLATVGLENRLEDLNRAAVRIAREVAGEKCLVAGNLSLTAFTSNQAFATAQQPLPLSSPATKDLELPINLPGERVAFQVGTNAVGAWFRLQRMVPSLLPDPWAPIRGVN